MGVGKPNFLLYQNTPILIDHELSLGFSDKASRNFDAFDWEFLNGDRSNNHVFLEILQLLRKILQ
jgi:hypothetical protein